MNRLKRIYKWTLFLFGVPTCIGCDDRLADPWSPICPECKRRYEAVKTVICPKCMRPLHRCSCVGEYLEGHFIKQHFKVFSYRNVEENDVANNLIYSMKRDNRADVREFLADELADALSDFLKKKKNVVFTNIPRRRSAIVEFGMDHAADLARLLARHFECEYIPLLVSKSKKAQKTTHGKDREHNVIFDYKGRNPKNLKGKTVIIVDDIVTTGASVATAGALIRALGAKNIIAASVAETCKEIPSEITPKKGRTKRIPKAEKTEKAEKATKTI